MGLLDKLIKDTKKTLEKKKKNLLDGNVIKEGRTWEQIARSFVTMAKEKFKEYPEGFAITGRKLREIVGNPDNVALRSWCREYGVSIKKSFRMNIYNITPFDIIKKRVKDSENNRLL